MPWHAGLYGPPGRSPDLTAHCFGPRTHAPPSRCVSRRPGVRCRSGLSREPRRDRQRGPEDPDSGPGCDGTGSVRSRVTRTPCTTSGVEPADPGSLDRLHAECRHRSSPETARTRCSARYVSRVTSLGPSVVIPVGHLSERTAATDRRWPIDGSTLLTPWRRRPLSSGHARTSRTCRLSDHLSRSERESSLPTGTWPPRGHEEMAAPARNYWRAASEPPGTPWSAAPPSTSSDAGRNQSVEELPWSVPRSWHSGPMPRAGRPAPARLPEPSNVAEEPRRPCPGPKNCRARRGGPPGRCHVSWWWACSTGPGDPLARQRRPTIHRPLPAWSLRCPAQAWQSRTRSAGSTPLRR